MKLFSLSLSVLLIWSAQAQTTNFNPPFIDCDDCVNWNSFLVGNLPQGISDVSDGTYGNGIMLLNPNKWFELGGADEMVNLLGLNNAYSFIIHDEKTIRGVTYSRYQQFYQGIKVENGGFTVAALTNDPDDDCLSSYLLALNVITGLEFTETTPYIQRSQIKNILENAQSFATQFPDMYGVNDYSITSSSLAAELIIKTGINDSCEGRLVWKSTYQQEGGKESYVDAATGQVLWVENCYMEIVAPINFADYSDPALSDPDNGIYKILLDDSTLGGTTSLSSSDGRIVTYNFASNTPGGGDYTSYSTDLIPTTTGSEWTSLDAPIDAYQIQLVMQDIIPIFDDMEINFGVVNAGFTYQYNAFAYTTSSTDDAFVIFGTLHDNFTALYDIAAHELTHCHLLDFISGTAANIGAGTLQEAIADMVGTYIESEIQGEVDWIIGDDITEMGLGIDRDLSQITQTQVTPEVLDLTDIYDRGDPLRHLFYILSEGQLSNPYVPALGIRRATELILDGVYILGSGSADYDLLKTTTIAQARMRYEECSDEIFALEAAWSAIGFGDETPCYTVIGNKVVCAEDNSLSLCINGGSSNETYYWNFPLGWTVAGATAENRVTGQCLTVLNFPNYPYYPQVFNLRVWSENSGAPQFVRVELQDCNGDGNDCADMLSSFDHYDRRNQHFQPYSLLEQGQEKTLPYSVSYIRVFDVMGREVCSGSPDIVQNQLLLQKNRVLIIAEFSEDDILLSVQKYVGVF